MSQHEELEFSLHPGRWYACEIIGDEFEADKCSYSPIKVHEVVEKTSSSGTFRLDFYHANYPEGARDKSYTLETVERSKSFLLARSADHDPVRLLQIYDIDRDWIVRHFTGIAVDDHDAQRWLDTHA